MPEQAQTGDTVAVHYTGTLENGGVFDSSREGDPIEFEVGSGDVIEGFDEGVEGMEPGEEREVRIPPERGYGQPRDHLRTDVPRSELPDEVEPEVGLMLAVEVEPGEEAAARIVDIGDERVTLDLNHPLAGKTLIFRIELVEIK